MDKKLLAQLKNSLEKEKKNIESQLKKFAEKDDKVKGDWDTRFPKFDGENSGSASLEKSADEVEEYSTLLPLEYNLETQLKDIDSALNKIEKNDYGKCENCQEEIDKDRLKAYPAAKFCMKCEGK